MFLLREQVKDRCLFLADGKIRQPEQSLAQRFDEMQCPIALPSTSNCHALKYQLTCQVLINKPERHRPDKDSAMRHQNRRSQMTLNGMAISSVDCKAKFGSLQIVIKV